MPPPSLPLRHDDSTPVSRARVFAAVRGRSPDRAGSTRTPGTVEGVKGMHPEMGVGSGSRRPPSRSTLDDIKAKARTQPITPTPLSRPAPRGSRSSNNIFSPTPPVNGTAHRRTLSPDPISSNQSTPSFPSRPFAINRPHSLAHIQQSSIPYSPSPRPPSLTSPDVQLIARAKNISLDPPPTQHPSALSSPLFSPDVVPTYFPPIISYRSLDYLSSLIDEKRLSISGSELSSSSTSGRGPPWPERDRLSGTTAVDDTDFADRLKSSPDLEITLDTDVESAKINRKIADLEISNASLLSINMSLEATKQKQRSEIFKLRRALRESLHLPAHAGPSTQLSALQSSSLPSPLPSTLSLLSAGSEGETYFDAEDELVDPELEGRWERISDMIGGMRRRAEGALEKEESGKGRVLGWMEVEGMGGRGETREGTPDVDDREVSRVEVEGDSSVMSADSGYTGVGVDQVETVSPGQAEYG